MSPQAFKQVLARHKLYWAARHRRWEHEMLQVERRGLPARRLSSWALGQNT